MAWPFAWPSALRRPARAQNNLLDKTLGVLGTLGETPSASSVLPLDGITAGLLEALAVGSERVVDQLGQADGFNGDPAIHIPLPGSMKKVQKTLRRVGLGSMGKDLELKLNRAAEAAVPEALDIFSQSISQMTFDDVEAIYNGPDDAATQYFQRTMTAPLTDAMRPIIDRSLADVGAVESFDAMMGEYQDLPFVPNVKTDLTDYALEEAMSGMFHYMAVEEAKIRNDPAARTTELLQSVFGN